MVSDNTTVSSFNCLISHYRSGIGGEAGLMIALIIPTAEAHPTTAHLFIINPLHGQNIRHLFSTYPPTEERIRRLRAMPAGHIVLL